MLKVNEGQSVRFTVEYSETPTAISWYVYDFETDAKIDNGTVLTPADKVTIETLPAATAITDDTKEYNRRQFVVESQFGSAQKISVDYRNFLVKNLQGA